MGHVEHAGLWHGAAFRLVETYDVDVAPDWSIRLARQPYGELVVIRSGSCRVRLGEQEALVGPGEAFALGRGEPRLTAAEGGGRLALFGFGYRLETVPGGDLSGVLGAPLAIAPAPRRLQLLVERAVRHGESSEPADSLRARASAELAVAELLALSSGVAVAPPGPLDRRRELVLQTIGELEDRYAEHLDLPAMAALVHVSPQHLAKVFRSVLQVTPTAYLKALRLSKARSLIALTDEPVTAIAYGCGFADPAHFSRAFSQRYGESPTAARRRGDAFAESDADAPAARRALTTIE